MTPLIGNPLAASAEVTCVAVIFAAVVCDGEAFPLLQPATTTATTGMSSHRLIGTTSTATSATRTRRTYCTSRKPARHLYGCDRCSRIGSVVSWPEG
jgi:hypothetical protein